jgi:TonB family protein
VAADTPQFETGRVADAPAMRAPESPSPSPTGEPDERARAALFEDNVRFVVRHHLPQVQACYQRQLKLTPAIGGTVELQFTLEPDGHVSSARTTSNSTGSEELASCVARTVMGWRFPGTGGDPADFIYPFTFSRGGD